MSLPRAIPAKVGTGFAPGIVAGESAIPAKVDTGFAPGIVAGESAIPAKVRTGFAPGIVVKRQDGTIQRFKEKWKCSTLKNLSRNGLLGVALITSLMMAQACTVRPLYSTSPEGSGSVSAASSLSSIGIKPVSTRQAQQVRNRLVFLFHGGAAEPSSPEYSLELNVAVINEFSATVQVTALDDEPTASMVTMIGSYTIRNTGDGAVVASGKRQVTSSYDVPRQEFAALRAQRDAENRAARELAELLRLAIAKDFSRK